LHIAVCSAAGSIRNQFDIVEQCTFSRCQSSFVELAF
jgi:hypothetical protein